MHRTPSSWTLLHPTTAFSIVIAQPVDRLMWWQRGDRSPGLRQGYSRRHRRLSRRPLRSSHVGLRSSSSVSTARQVTSAFTVRLFDRLTVPDWSGRSCWGLQRARIDRWTAGLPCYCRFHPVWTSTGRQYSSPRRWQHSERGVMVLMRDDDVNGRLVSPLTVISVCFSNHHLITCFVGIPLHCQS